MAARFGEVMTAGQIPGLAFAVIRDQEVICSRGFGVTSAEEEMAARVTPGTLFRIGSITKVLSGLAILRLVDAGRLDLDRPVIEYLPWLQLSDPAAAGQITARMLLTHSAGLPTDGSDRGSRDPEGLKRFLQAQLPQYPLVAAPGRLYCYSNVGYSLLGHVAEEVTGQTYPALMQELVFGPLQMERTTLDPTVAMSYPLSQSHRLDGDGRVFVARPFADNVAFAPAGFAYSTAPDLANVARMLLVGGEFGGLRYLSRGLVEAMKTAAVPTYSPGDGGRGLALHVDRHPLSGLARVGHAGGITGYVALFEFYPASGTAVVLLMNRASAVGPVRNILLEECLGLPVSGWRPAVVEPAADRSDWPAYAGTYLSETEGLAQVRIEGDGLVLDWNGTRFDLACHGPGHYVAPWRNGAYVGAGFLPGAGGGPAEYLMLGEAPYRRVEPVEHEGGSGEWARYAGTYRHSQPPMTVRVEEGTLFLHSAFYGEEARCVPLGGAAFACKWGRFTFETGPDGEVASMRWGHGRSVPRVG